MGEMVYETPGSTATATPAARQSVHALLQSTSERASKLPEDVLQEVYPPLMAAQMELERDLARLLKELPNGGDRFEAHHLRTALRQIRGALDTIDKLKPTLKGTLVRGAFAAGELSNASLAREMARLSTVFGDELPQLDLLSVERLMDRNSWLIGRFERSAAKYSEDAKSNLRMQFAIGVAKNETIDQLTRRIMRLSGEPLGATGVANQMAEGLFRGRYSDAERLVRTEMLNTYNAHHQRSIEENGLLKRWDATQDWRLCRWCASFDGKVVEADEEFAPGQMYPPLHPRCRCILVPWKEGWPELTSLPPLETREAQRLALAGDPGLGAHATSRKAAR